MEYTNGIPSGLKYPKVVIIVLNFNQKADTLRCLESLFKADYPDFEVLLVDNGSNDGSSEEISRLYCKVHLIRNKTNLGAAGGRNVALRHAEAYLKSEFVFFLDNDTIVHPSFLREIVRESLQVPDVGMAYPKILSMDPPHLIQYAGNYKFNFYKGDYVNKAYCQPDRGQFDRKVMSMIAPGINLSRMEVYRRIGEFDESFNPYGREDIDFSLRARRAGFKILFVPSSVVYHKGTRTGFQGNSDPEYAYNKGKKLKIFLKKHATPFQLAVFYFLSPIFVFPKLVGKILQGNINGTVSEIKGYFFR